MLGSWEFLVINSSLSTQPADAKLAHVSTVGAGTICHADVGTHL